MNLDYGYLIVANDPIKPKLPQIALLDPVKLKSRSGDSSVPVSIYTTTIGSPNSEQPNCPE